MTITEEIMAHAVKHDLRLFSVYLNTILLSKKDIEGLDRPVTLKLYPWIEDRDPVTICLEAA